MADKSYVELFDLKMLKIMLKNSLETENAEDLGLVVEEFIRRGKGDIPLEMARKFLKKSSTRIGTEFARTLSLFLSGARIAEAEGGDSMGVTINAT